MNRYKALNLNNKWVYGDLLYCDDFIIIVQGNELYIEEEYNFRGDTHFFKLSGVMCKNDSECRNIGITDCKDIDIYENDILQSEYEETKYVIKYSNEKCRYIALSLNNNMIFDVTKEWVYQSKKNIIGNILDVNII